MKIFLTFIAVLFTVIWFFAIVICAQYIAGNLLSFNEPYHGKIEYDPKVYCCVVGVARQPETPVYELPIYTRSSYSENHNLIDLSPLDQQVEWYYGYAPPWSGYTRNNAVFSRHDISINPEDVKACVLKDKWELLYVLKILIRMELWRY